MATPSVDIAVARYASPDAKHLNSTRAIPSDLLDGAVGRGGGSMAKSDGVV